MQHYFHPLRSVHTSEWWYGFKEATSGGAEEFYEQRLYEGILAVR